MTGGIRAPLRPRAVRPAPPRFVALCGAPMSGKTSVAEMLVRRYSAEIVDDGAVLRDAAMALYGAPREDFYSQAGKARTRTVCGREFTNRQLLGDLGNLLEGFYGEQFMPERALAGILEHRCVPFWVFPSCRKTQGLTYRARGGIVVEVHRPGFEPVNDFDRWDHEQVTHLILNSGSMDQLERHVAAMFDQIVGAP